MRRFFLWVCFLLACLSTNASAQTADLGIGKIHGVEDLAPLQLTQMITRVASFLPDGTDATIFRAWSFGAEGGHWIYVVAHERNSQFYFGNTSNPGVMAPVLEANVVSLSPDTDPSRSDPKKFQDVIADNPQFGMKSVVFARGRIRGSTASLLVVANRLGPEKKSSKVEVTVYRLTSTAFNDHASIKFNPVARWVTTGLYCNSYNAFANSFGLQPLSRESSQSCD